MESYFIAIFKNSHGSSQHSFLVIGTIQGDKAEISKAIDKIYDNAIFCNSLKFYTFFSCNSYLRFNAAENLFPISSDKNIRNYQYYAININKEQYDNVLYLYSIDDFEISQKEKNKLQLISLTNSCRDFSLFILNFILKNDDFKPNISSNPISSFALRANFYQRESNDQMLIFPKLPFKTSNDLNNKNFNKLVEIYRLMENLVNLRSNDLITEEFKILKNIYNSFYNKQLELKLSDKKHISNESQTIFAKEIEFITSPDNKQIQHY